MKHSNEQRMYRQTRAEVNLDAIEANVSRMVRHLGDQTKVMAVVKANAYGHGDVEVAQTALKAGADHLAVATLDEAVSLREKGIQAPLVVLGWTPPNFVSIAVDLDIALTAFQADWIEAAGASLEGKTCKLHIKFDTGMSRLGIRTSDEFHAFVKALHTWSSSFDIEGCFTHFAAADQADTRLLDQQKQQFEQRLAQLEKAGITPRLVHSENSAAGMMAPERAVTYCRYGIAMYGLAPSKWVLDNSPFPLEPALALRTNVVAVRKISAGDTVGYGAEYMAEKEEYIATLPIGYADGWLRHMKGFYVIVDDQKAPIVGRVCMDQCMVAVPEKIDIGTDVTLIGNQGGHSITADDVANYAGTINYEIPCLLSLRVPRIFLRNKRIIGIRNKVLGDK
ncbi:alanine racemase [Aureibacillus halotolerans]|uniref:Alanine racemase n=1 Tax=Aureibacillus halotolerans TaxID=1508390 RepID=A0A4R6TXW5_9BACI|nr:alanine racemase [Aureibacillus halotolerans]TDQ36725.1 alanine racemase [Aureibacillus halotolerans]